MALALSASTVKSWFQYRCERKVRYELFTDDDLASVPIVKDVREQSWATLGIDYEERVLRRLAREAGVLRPAPGDFGLGEAEAVAFLRGRKPEPYASQINLRPRTMPRFLQGAGVELRRVYPDLVECRTSAGRLRFKVIDVKATRHATPFHKTQVAFYVRTLEALLLELGQPADLDLFGEIWRIPDGGSADGDAHQVERFELAPYLRLVDEFCTNQLPQMAAKRVEAGVDETFFHLYFKCEQCAFLEHCLTSISPDRPAADRDVSAVAGLTHEGKRSLARRRIRTVGQLASAAGLATAPGVGWSLSRRAEVLSTRANALITGGPLRTEEAHTFLMPPRADAVFLLSVDHDPVDDRLAALGYALQRDGHTVCEQIEVIPSGRGVDEADAMERVLSRLVADLMEIDAANQAGAQIQAHIFLYEPTEAANLQRAVGRHLEDPRIRGGLLHLVRLFPPEDVVPEPEFRGAHHLPATAIRSVVEQLYGLPVNVSYDLRQVSQALHAAGGIPVAYMPEPDFARPFSSLLSIDVIRGLREARARSPDVEQVSADVAARLRAAGDIVAWLFAENARAPQPMLRLNKRPFRLHATFDPLNADDLDLLLACEILESRAGMLEALIGLAQPARRRRDTGRAMTGLTVVQHWAARGRRFLILRVPPESRESELGPGAFGLILTDDDPDVRLDPSQWPALGCQIEAPSPGYEDRSDQIRVSLRDSDFTGPVFRPMFERALTEPVWCLDKGFADFNGDRAARFITDLARTPGR